MIWLSVKREFFIEFPFKSNNLEILLLTHIKGWGDYRGITPRLSNWPAPLQFLKEEFPGIILLFLNIKNPQIPLGPSNKKCHSFFI